MSRLQRLSPGSLFLFKILKSGFPFFVVKSILLIFEILFRNIIPVNLDGEMAEWLNAAVSKTVVGSGSPGVRISLSPQGFTVR